MKRISGSVKLLSWTPSPNEDSNLKLDEVYKDPRENSKMRLKSKTVVYADEEKCSEVDDVEMDHVNENSEEGKSCSTKENEESSKDSELEENTYSSAIFAHERYLRQKDSDAFEELGSQDPCSSVKSPFYVNEESSSPDWGQRLSQEESQDEWEDDWDNIWVHPSELFIDPDGTIYNQKLSFPRILPCSYDYFHRIVCTKDDFDRFMKVTSRDEQHFFQIILDCLGNKPDLEASSVDYLKVAVQLLEIGLNRKGCVDLSVFEAIPVVWYKIRQSPLLTELGPTIRCLLLRLMFLREEDLFRCQAIHNFVEIYKHDQRNGFSKDFEDAVSQFAQYLFHDENIDIGNVNAETISGHTIDLLSKLAVVSGSELTEKLILPFFLALGSSPRPLDRQWCAIKMHELSLALSESVVESSLLPMFIKLCHDQCSSIPESCSEAIVSISSKCSMEVRKTVLARIFINFLSVLNGTGVNVVAMYRYLGPFITTFAHPPIAHLKINEDCEVVLSYSNGAIFQAATASRLHLISFLSYDLVFKAHGWESKNNKPRNEEDFSSFNYWRDPITNCFDYNEIASVMKDGIVNEVPVEKMTEEWWVFSDKTIECIPICDDVEEETSSNVDVEFVNSLVPYILIKHYFAIVKIHYTDFRDKNNPINFLPAVVLTLGKKNWNLLKSAFESLATSAEWKVRLIISSSIHDVANMIGQEKTEEDLLPVFFKIMQDEDKVRYAAVGNLYLFLTCLSSSARATFLPKFSEFLLEDFRHREELLNQMTKVLPLYTATDNIVHLAQFVVKVLQDKVAAVRSKAIHLAYLLIWHVHLNVDSLVPENENCDEHPVMHKIFKLFYLNLARSSNWRHRQTYALLASALFKAVEIPGDTLETVLKALLELSEDKVVNVRIAVARTLSRDALRLDCLDTQVVKCQLESLSNDKDPDVRELSLSHC